MAQLKIGDWAKIRLDLIAGEVYGRVFCSVRRIEEFGKRFKVYNVYHNDVTGTTLYGLEGSPFAWPPEMLEPNCEDFDFDGKSESGLITEE